MAHTPGPWEPFGRLTPNRLSCNIQGDGRRVNVARVFLNEEGGYDNAHLIASAPDLLEALKIMVERCALIYTHPDLDPEFIKARAAIAKAEGGA